MYQQFQFIDVFRRLVRQIAVFGMIPDLLHWVEFRRMTGQPLHLKATGPIQQLAHRGPMDTPAIQDEDEALRLPTAQGAQEGQHLLGANVASVPLPTQTQTLPLRRNADGADQRQSVMPLPLAQLWRMPSGGPGAAHQWLQHEAAFIHEDDATPLAARLFLYA